jgi:hypothetical protein
VKVAFQYARFFLYETWNWNTWLEFFILIYDIREDLNDKIRTFSPMQLKHLTIVSADLIKSSSYEAVSNYMLEKVADSRTKIFIRNMHC